MLFYNFFLNILTISKTVVFNFNDDLKNFLQIYKKFFTNLQTSQLSAPFSHRKTKKVVNLQYPIPEFLEEFMK